MHDIEPWWGWKDEYSAEEDRHSAFYGRTYDEFKFTSKIYNYYIHPQWDHFGSETLYCKLLYVDYRSHFACLELIGEWNDSIYNDIMFLKREVIDVLIDKKVTKFVLFCDNVLNYHGDDDSYYEEWYDDIREDDGWICLVNCFDHIISEMKRYRLHHYMDYGPDFNWMNWRTQKPPFIIQAIENNDQQKHLK
jgi:hypothetical protein